LEIEQITSIVLDRTKPFDHNIKLMIDDYVAETISVTQINGYATLMSINKAWFQAIEERKKK